MDLVQIGARNMQNFDLLKEVGKMSKPVLLKRGLANSYEEWIMSAEYIMAEGNENVILCERGVRTFETYTRNTLDLSAIPAIQPDEPPAHRGGSLPRRGHVLDGGAAGHGGHRRGGGRPDRWRSTTTRPTPSATASSPSPRRSSTRLMDKARPLVELMGKHLV